MRPPRMTQDEEGRVANGSVWMLAFGARSRSGPEAGRFGKATMQFAPLPGTMEAVVDEKRAVALVMNDEKPYLSPVFLPRRPARKNRT